MPEWKPDIRNRLASLRLDPVRENGIVEELAGHLEDRYQEMLARGASFEEAHVSALRELSDGELLVRELRRLERQLGDESLVLGARRTNMLGNLWQDLRFGLRLIRKNPAFSAVVVLTLAIGIGANTAIFSVVNTVMLRSLPFRDADRLVRLNESNPDRGWPTFSVSHPNFLDWRDRNQTFAAIAATTGANATLGTAGEIEVVRGSAVTSDFLTVLGTTPLMGRGFLPEEDKPGGNSRVVMLTYGSWQKRFGAAQDIVGRTMTLDAHRSQKQKQRTPDLVRDEPVIKPLRGDEPTFVALRILLGELRGDRVHIGERLFLRNTLFELADHQEPMIATRARGVVCERHQQLEVGGSPRKGLRQYSYDRKAVVVERHRPAYDVLSGAEALLPRTISKHNHS